MKWIIALIVSAVMFMTGYYHAERYVDDDSEESGTSAAESVGDDNDSEPEPEPEPEPEMADGANPAAQD